MEPPSKTSSPLPTSMPARDLPDMNVWLVLADPDHPHQERARRYSEGAPQLAFRRLSMLSLRPLLSFLHLTAIG